MRREELGVLDLIYTDARDAAWSRGTDRSPLAVATEGEVEDDPGITHTPLKLLFYFIRVLLFLFSVFYFKHCSNMINWGTKSFQKVMQLILW